MIALDAVRAGRAMGIGPLAGPVTGVSIDTRSLQAGDVFVALRGERFDGHEFVQAAFAAGASGAVVQRAVGVAAGAVVGSAMRGAARPDGGPLYQVEDTLEALGALAREVRRISGVTVLAVTGSAGKTSTKDLLRAMVGRVRRVSATSGNQNNEVGVPLTLLSIDADTQAVVVEMGMRGRGQIAALAAVAEPDVGLITNVHPVHLELLGSLEDIAEAKAELLAGVRPGGAAVVPADCRPLLPHLAGCACRVVRFAVGAEECAADVAGWLEDEAAGRQAWVLRWPGGETRVPTRPLSRHTLENAVAAAAACYAAGLPVEECVAGLADVQFSGGRGQLVEVGGLCLIDDTYNANPAAVRAAVDDLVRLAGGRKGRAVAVLGDMLELGPDSQRFHEEVGAYAAQAGVRALWGVGPLALATVEGFRRRWTEHRQADLDWSAGQVDSSAEVSSVLAGLQPGDVILFKASRSVRLENMVNRVVDEASSGRWGTRYPLEDERVDDTGVRRQC